MNTQDPFPRSTALRVTTLLLTGIVGCGAVDDGSVAYDDAYGDETSTESAEQIDSKLIFPDSELDFCDPNLVLTCPAQATFSFERMDNDRRGRTVDTVDLPLVAGLSTNADTMACESPRDYSTTLDSIAINLPEGVTAQLARDRSHVAFSEPVNNLYFDPPNLSGIGGAMTCGLDCTPGGAVPQGCDQSRLETSAFEGTMTVNGVSRRVTYRGQVAGNPTPDPETGRLEVACTLFLDRSLVAIERRDRNHDVIDTSGSRFIRGYELSGSELETACSELAVKQCTANVGRRPEGIETCIDDNTRRCVSDFSGADPCDRQDFEQPK